MMNMPGAAVPGKLPGKLQFTQEQKNLLGKTYFVASGTQLQYGTRLHLLEHV